MTSRSTRRAFLAAAVTGTVAGCLGELGSPNPGAWRSHRAIELPVPDVDFPVDEPETTLEVEPVIDGLEIPWDMTFDADGTMYLTERTGRVLAFDGDELAAVARPRDVIDAETATEGWYVAGGEGGTLGVAASPASEYLFVYYTAEVEGVRFNRVVRYDRTADDPASTVEPVVSGIPAATVHNGGRVRFGPEGHLWITTGDAAEPSFARDPDSLAGKILRVDEDGEAPSDPPAHEGDDRIYTAGHRNVQGLDWIDGMGIITEHGPGGRDEVSLVYPGGDYGWDEVRGPPADTEYDSYARHSTVVPPLVNTTVGTTWAPSGATWYTGDAIPSWRNRLVVGGLISQRVWVLTLSPGNSPVLPPIERASHRFDADYLDGRYTVTVHAVLDDVLGRVRHLEQAPDGALYALTSNRDGRAHGPFPRETDDRIVRIRPVES